MKFKLKIIIFVIILKIHIAHSNDAKVGDKLILEQESTAHYNYRLEYSPNLQKIFKKYLLTKKISENCNQNLGFVSNLSPSDFETAFHSADSYMTKFIANDQRYLASDPRGLNFSYYIYQANLHAKLNEVTTKNLAVKKCLSKFDVTLNLPSFKIPEGIWNRNRFCDLKLSGSPFLKCDTKTKYRRIDGKCNNLVKNNWGSSFHCNRRLLPPDYADGVSQPRVASDGSPLPNPRLITKQLLPEINEIDSIRSLMHMSWGQFVVHDILKTLQYFGLAIDCCSFAHEECISAEDIPQDELTKAYNQSCLNIVRSLACNTCGLGYREQLNAATSTFDLSQLYGGNENNTVSLRTFKKGELRGEKLQDNSEILPKAILPYDQDTLDLTECSPPADRPWLTCLLNGDGARGNQQPMIMALTTIMRKRHNQHANALSKVNQHWTDEILFQEARRILIAEYTKINYAEYFPKILNKQLMDYYHLNVRQKGFTQYNPNVDPSMIQAVIVAALRFGHSQINSRFKVVKKSKQDTYGFQLRAKFNDVSDIWDGNTNGVIGGLIGTPALAVDSFIVSDVHDHLFFKPSEPNVQDLPARTITRGRDHGVPAYIHYLQYCTGIEVKGWPDLIRFIPENYVRTLSTVYKDPKDVDLFVGGLAERHMNGSLVGPTFGCLLAIQMFHWKYGDRFYFEHGGQTGSFTIEQLNNIRKTSSMANLLCKTTDFDATPVEPMLMSDKNTVKIPCDKLPDLDYNLWREDSSCVTYCDTLRQNKN